MLPAIQAEDSMANLGQVDLEALLEEDHDVDHDVDLEKLLEEVEEKEHIETQVRSSASVDRVHELVFS